MSNEACLVLDALIISAVAGLNAVLLRRTGHLESIVGGRRSSDDPTGSADSDG